MFYKISLDPASTQSAQHLDHWNIQHRASDCDCIGIVFKSLDLQKKQKTFENSFEVLVSYAIAAQFSFIAGWFKTVVKRASMRV